LLAYHLFSGKSPRQSAERRTLLLLVAVAVVFGAIHFARPNLTLTVQGAGLSPIAIPFFRLQSPASWRLSLATGRS
jgi:hypothetical protein